MIFAFIDYVQYRFRFGTYSDASLRAAGGIQVTADRVGDPTRFAAGSVFVLHVPGSVLSWAVMYFTHSLWSHCGLLDQGGQVVDATLSGVKRHSFLDYCDGRIYIMVLRLQHPLTPDEVPLLTMSLNRTIGARFNWRGVIWLWWQIVTCNHHHYRLRYSIDIIVLLVLLGGLAWWWSCAAFWAIGAAGLAYVVVLASNAVHSRHSRQSADWATAQQLTRGSETHGQSE